MTALDKLARELVGCLLKVEDYATLAANHSNPEAREHFQRKRLGYEMRADLARNDIRALIERT